MIQELLGGGKMSIPSTTTILTALSTPTTSTTTTTTTLVSPSNPSGCPKNNSEANLRCPRCESTNTKFCYYNNYNLTQPRHFCKTCRRYWTKGGTLRNVPIGGGCRKNRTSATSATSSSPASSSKPKPTLSTEMLVNAVNPSFHGNGFLDHLQGPSPTLWHNSVLPQGQSSHFLALLRGAAQFPSLNPNPSPIISSPFSPHKTECPTNNGLDPYSNGAPTLHGSYMRSNQYQVNGSGLGGPDINVPNGGYSSNILELYQRFKSSPDYCGNENPRAVILGNVVGSSTSSSPSSSAMNSTVLEATPVGGAGDHNMGGGYGIMTSAISNWTEFPTVPF